MVSRALLAFWICLFYSLSISCSTPTDSSASSWTKDLQHTGSAPILRTMSDANEHGTDDEHEVVPQIVADVSSLAVDGNDDVVEAAYSTYYSRLLQSSHVLKDALPWAQSASNTGFDVAGKITSIGFTIAQTSISVASYACMAGGAALAAGGIATAGPILFAGGVGLAAVNEGVGLAKDITLRSQGVGKLFTHHSIGTVSKVCSGNYFDYCGL